MSEELIKKPIKKKIKFSRDIVTTVFVTAIISGVLGGMAVGLFQGQIRDAVNEITTKKVTVEEESATIDVVNKVSPSVVSITGEQSTLNFFGQSQTSQTSGTGFIVTADGLIATNKHVVSSESATYSVFTSDGKEYKAQVKATDPYFDIAFLKIDAKDLVPLDLGDSDSIKVGQKVIAIGNALGQFQNTVTTGVISAVGRSLEASDASGSSSEVLENMIQTDAAINSGNSGGPLVNIDGQVIGMNTAVASNSEGIGFATPINVIKTALASVQKSGKITRPMLGVRYISISKEFATRNNLSVDHGALIYSTSSDLAVLPGTPAAKAGLKENDIIIKIGDYEIREGQSLVSALSNFTAGDKVNVVYIRDGKEKTVTVTLAESK